MKEKILIVNGINLRQLGTREINIYGVLSFEEYLHQLRETFPDLEIEYFQSDREDELATKVADATGYLGILLNAGAYTHSSVVLADAVRTCQCRTIEVHISNLFGREQYRRESMLSSACHGFICGFGLDGYRLGILALLK